MKPGFWAAVTAAGYVLLLGGVSAWNRLWPETISPVFRVAQLRVSIPPAEAPAETRELSAAPRNRKANEASRAKNALVPDIEVASDAGHYIAVLRKYAIPIALSRRTGPSVLLLSLADGELHPALLPAGTEMYPIDAAAIPALQRPLEKAAAIFGIPASKVLSHTVYPESFTKVLRFRVAARLERGGYDVARVRSVQVSYRETPESFDVDVRNVRMRAFLQ